MKPDSLNIRTYQVGFGDAFLLSFLYPDGSKRHVLMDFGSTALPKGAPPNRMIEVAEDIRQITGGRLHAVVATHRHKDHISGFATNAAGTASGDIIRSLDIDLVLQPWTEDPTLEPDAMGPAPSSKGLRFSALRSMQQVAGQVYDSARRASFLPTALKAEIEFLGDDNISNRPAVENLMTMGKERRYLNIEEDSGLGDILPGVETIVLGPPNAEQSKAVLKQRSSDENEFWHLRALTGESVAERGDDKSASLFDRQYVAADGSASFPEGSRWLIYRARKMQASQMLGIVRALDKAMNNTSLILLFRVGGKSLLFPGDAQIENWTYALDQPKYRKLLAEVDLYKVGHHGSLNATPKTLWGLFKKRTTDKAAEDRLDSVMSTMPGKHGSVDKDTEVPRRTLTEALRKESNLLSTHDIPATTLYVDKVIHF